MAPGGTAPFRLPYPPTFALAAPVWISNCDWQGSSARKQGGDAWAALVQALPRHLPAPRLSPPNALAGPGYQDHGGRTAQLRPHAHRSLAPLASRLPTCGQLMTRCSGCSLWHLVQWHTTCCDSTNIVPLTPWHDTSICGAGVGAQHRRGVKHESASDGLASPAAGGLARRGILGRRSSAVLPWAG